MIKDITITGVKYELNATTKKYVERKIATPCPKKRVCRCED